VKLGLFGNPVAHSKSPAIFAALGRMIGRSISYEAVRVEGTLDDAVAAARADGWKGANVTIPFKLRAAQFADGLTASAKRVGAVNVLRFGGQTMGHNTDADGLRDALKGAGIALKGRSVLIFGAGGAARAAGCACGQERASRVRFVNRTETTARRLARELGGYFPATKFSAGAASGADVWINATPLGQGGSEESPVGATLPAPEAAIDLVYGKETTFQRQARKLGAATVDGTGMLVHQALRAWEYWDKPLGPRRAELARRIIEEIS
jgi:shikimate dehydrogenase